MNELSSLKLWGMRVGFALLTLLILFVHLLPLDTTPAKWAAPNLLMGFALAWSLRRPEFVPGWLLAALFLLSDLLLQRPPGLWAALALIGCENMKSRARGMRDGAFPGEWLTACITILAITIAYRIALMITLVDLPGIGLTLFQMVMTMIFYPVIVAVTHGIMGVRKTAPVTLTHWEAESETQPRRSRSQSPHDLASRGPVGRGTDIVRRRARCADAISAS